MGPSALLRRRNRTVGVVVAVAVLALVAALAWFGARSIVKVSLAQTNLTPTPSGPAAVVPQFSHVYTIVLENRSSTSVFDSAQAPYLNQLAARYGVADAYQAVAHPSQPNYLALFSGSTQGVTDNQRHDIDALTIADQLEAAGRSWRVFAENVPTGCFTGLTADGGPDGSGTYARKHEPAISFTSISGSPTRCANVQPMSEFDPAAADYAFIVPNMCNGAHDCPLSAADAWLKRFVPRILDSAAWKDGGILFITFDEADDQEREANRVATFVIAPSVAPGTRSSVPHSHYSLLHTVQDGLGLDCLALSCEANTLGEFFR
ncbi:MAG: alkaline phosphatase family protein [Chloroflexota bacterium]|nr:alkaline phosphatase family protein [Chloroflexota bacterium]